MKVYTIIVTYNGAQWIEKCLDSLRLSTVQSEVIVIDNASSDDTVSIIRQKYPEVELIESDKNQGFGKANNIGLKKALNDKADYVLLLNQDTRIEREMIEKLIDVSESNPGYGILSPFHFNYEGDKTERYFEEWVLKHYTPDLNTDRENGTLKAVYTTSFVHAACWLMPIETIKKVGGFDPLFFHTGEDNDYIQRLSTKLLKIGIASNAMLFHKGTNEGLTGPESNLQLQINNKLLMLKNPKSSTLGVVLLFFRQYKLSKHQKDKVKLSADKYIAGRLFRIIISRYKQNRKLCYL